MNNYLKLFKDEIASLNERKRLLLHVCCGPCSMYPLKLLVQYFDITIYFTNSNIYPYSEYKKRLEELLRYLDHLNDSRIQIVIPQYDDSFCVTLKEYAHEKEGGKRCVKCYAMRLIDAFKYAKAHQFDYCTTIMSISNHKNANYINHIGKLCEKQFGISFLYNDFKKEEGLAHNQRMNREFELYHQDYCGCPYSLNDRKERF